MLNRSRGLAAAALLTSALVTLTACGGSDGTDGDTGDSSASGASASASASPGKGSNGNASSSSDKTGSSNKKDTSQAADKGSDKGSGGTSGKVSLPEPGGSMKVAAAGEDVMSGLKMVFYSLTDGSGTDALGDYSQKLNSAGFLAEMPDENTLQASKGGVELEFVATHGWSMNELVTLQVNKGSIDLPAAPQEADIVNSVPELSGENALVAGGSDAGSGTQVAFYAVDSDFMSYWDKGGYKCSPNQQDGEDIENYYRCTHDENAASDPGAVLNVEVAKNPLVGSLAIVTPAEA